MYSGGAVTDASPLSCVALLAASTASASSIAATATVLSDGPPSLSVSAPSSRSAARSARAARRTPALAATSGGNEIADMRRRSRPIMACSDAAGSGRMDVVSPVTLHDAPRTGRVPSLSPRAGRRSATMLDSTEEHLPSPLMLVQLLSTVTVPPYHKHEMTRIKQAIRVVPSQSMRRG